MLAFFERGGDQKLNIDNLRQSMLVKQNVDLKTKCEEKPKLRTFNTFKNFGITPPYLLMPLSFVQKKFIAKIRLSALAIRIETGRYERPKLIVQHRLCPSCKDGQSVENEEHFVFECIKYNSLRGMWFDKLVNLTIFPPFLSLKSLE